MTLAGACGSQCGGARSAAEHLANVKCCGTALVNKMYLQREKVNNYFQRNL